MLQDHDFAVGVAIAPQPLIAAVRHPSLPQGHDLPLNGHGSGSGQRLGSSSEGSLPALMEMLRRCANAYSSLYHAEMAEALGLGAGDIKALELVMEFEPLTTGQLATLAGLSSGGVTAVIDRLERAGYVMRDKHRFDRRMIVLRPVPERCARLQLAPPHLLDTMLRLDERHSDEELLALHCLLSQAIQLLRQRATRLLDQRVGTRPVSRR